MAVASNHNSLVSLQAWFLSVKGGGGRALSRGVLAFEGGLMRASPASNHWVTCYHLTCMIQAQLLATIQQQLPHKSQCGAVVTASDYDLEDPALNSHSAMEA